MFQKALGTALLLGSLLLDSAHASSIWIEGATRDENQFGAGQTIKHSDFVITYRNDELPWGAQVELIHGLQCQVGGPWKNQSYPQALEAVSPHTWQIRLDNVTTGDRYSGFCRDLQFVFRLTLPGGAQYYDNGGKAPMGYYSAPIPYHSTGRLENLPVQPR